MNRIRANVSNERGAAAVEFALLSTVLFMIIFGIIEFGQFYSKYTVFQSAAREGARFAAVRGIDNIGPTTAEVTARVDQAADPYSRSGAVSVTPACSSTTRGQPITVQWTQNFEISIPLLPAWQPTLDIKGVFRCE